MDKDLSKINKDERCLIFSKLTKLGDIKNTIKAYPQYSRLVYSCIKIIEDDEETIPVDVILRMTNLEEANVRIFVDTNEQLIKLANRNLPFIYIILSERFGKGNKGGAYLKFMETTQLFVKTWVKNKYIGRKIRPYEDFPEITEAKTLGLDEEEIEEEETFFRAPVSHIINKTLIIERLNEDEIDYDNDRTIRFIYSQGTVHIYKNNLYGKSRNIMFSLLELLSKNNALDRLEIFTTFLGDIENHADALKYIHFFKNELDTVKSYGFSYQVGTDIPHWLGIAIRNINIEKVYFVPTVSIISDIYKVAPKFRAAQLMVGLDDYLRDTTNTVNEVFTSFILPVFPSRIPKLLELFPNLETIGLISDSFTRAGRIEDIEKISSTYPNLNIVVFLTSDPPEPKLPNVRYKLLG